MEWGEAASVISRWAADGCKLIYLAPTISQCIIGDCVWVSRCIFRASPVGRWTFECNILLKGDDDSLNMLGAVRWHDATWFWSIHMFLCEISRMAVARLCTKGTQPSYEDVFQVSLISNIFSIINYIIDIYYHPTSSFLLDWAVSFLCNWLRTWPSVTLNGVVNFMMFDLDEWNCTIWQNKYRNVSFHPFAHI